MNNNLTSTQSSKLTADTQSRLLAYSTAASLGAFFAGQSTEAALVQAPGLAPYPHVFLPGPVGSTNGSEFYLSVDGGNKTNFTLNIFPDLLSHPTNKWPSQVIDIIGFVPDTNNPAVVNGQVLAPLRANGDTNAYCVAFLGGAIIGNNSNSIAPWYAPRIGISYNYGAYPWVNYAWSTVSRFPDQFLGFKFTGSADGQNHFGYMDVRVTLATASIDYIDPTGNPATATKQVVKSVVVNDCRYETTPDAAVTVPTAIQITGFVQDPSQNNMITIDFGPNWPNDDTSNYILETSPTLGPTAVWTADPQAIVFQKGASTSAKAATYQALTYPATGATSQFWRIKKQ
jgi:hypothetical protein